MRAASVSTLPEPGGRQLVYEPKWDGWRCLAHVGGQVVLHSRHGRDLAAHFPDVVAQLRDHVPPGVVLDGELIIWDPGRSRTSFTALQRRVTAGHALAGEAAQRPAHFVVFDLLADADGTPTLDRPLAQRRERLQQLLADRSPQLPICPQTTDADQARRWLHDWTAIGIEGLVIKDLAGRYTPGKAGWNKLKSHTSTEAIIGGVTGSLTDPGILLLGRFDAAGRLRYVAQTHPLAASHRREVTGLLAPLALPGGTAEHPWPQPLPATWNAQFHQRQPLPYVRVRPLIVAEVQVDAAYDADHGRWRHPARYLRPRADLSAGDVPHWRPEPERHVVAPDAHDSLPPDRATA
jgi:ATP-dependent DNA ligase